MYCTYVSYSIDVKKISLVRYTILLITNIVIRFLVSSTVDETIRFFNLIPCVSYTFVHRGQEPGLYGSLKI